VRCRRRNRPGSALLLPLAKNLCWIATALYENVERGKRTVIPAGNPYEEPDFEAEGRPPWRPWLWSRIPRAQLPNVDRGIDDPELAWPAYFQHLNHSSKGVAPTDAPAPARGPDCVKERVLRMAACADYAFRLNEHMAGVIDDFKVRSGWDDTEPKIGIHLRRGDAATEDLGETTRPSYPLEKYLEVADTICERHGIRTIYLSTESETEVQRAHELRPQYRVLSLDHDRDIFPRIADTSIFIEDLALADHSAIEPIVNSAIADLWFLQHCSAFIGTFNSEFSMLAWLLCIGHHGCFVPYVNLSEIAELEAYQGVLEFRLIPQDV
jgi:hypothetical protein